MQQHLFDYFSSEGHSNFLDHNFLPRPLTPHKIRGAGGFLVFEILKEGGHEKITQK